MRTENYLPNRHRLSVFDLVGNPSGREKGSRGGPAEVQPDMQAGAAFLVVARGCIRNFCLNAALLVDGGSSEAVHRARVALRRLASAVSLFGSLMPDEQRRELRRRLKEVLGPLGEARNLDVFITRCPSDELDMVLLSGRALELRSAAYARLAETLSGPSACRLPVDAVEWIEACAHASPEAEEPVHPYAARHLEKRLRSFRRRSRDLEAASPHCRHRARIAAKKLRYASEFFLPLVADDERRAAKRFIDALKAVQAVLGELNDVRVNGELANRVAVDAPYVAFAAARLARAEQRRGESLVRRAVKARDRFTREEPFWKGWREEA